ncbi:MAG: ABC transporter ATP-binding protein [Acidiferrobacterales bacterium]
MNTLTTSNLRLVAGDKMLIENLNIEFRSGQSWAILGPNGSGKSTLLHTLAGLVQPASGTIHYNNRDLNDIAHRYRAQHIGIVFQDFDNAFPTSVLDTVMAGRHPHLARSLFATESGEDIERVNCALIKMALVELADRSITTLSGGERRRTDIAVLLAQNPQVRLLDEPSNHLDLYHQHSVLSLLTSMARDDSTGAMNIIALHDINQALHYCDHGILLFADGSVRHGPLKQIATQSELERLYGCKLIEIESGQSRLFMPGTLAEKRN